MGSTRESSPASEALAQRRDPAGTDAAPSTRLGRLLRLLHTISDPKVLLVAWLVVAAASTLLYPIVSHAHQPLRLSRYHLQDEVSYLSRRAYEQYAAVSGATGAMLGRQASSPRVPLLHVRILGNMCSAEELLLQLKVALIIYRERLAASTAWPSQNMTLNAHREPSFTLGRQTAALEVGVYYYDDDEDPSRDSICAERVRSEHHAGRSKEQPLLEVVRVQRVHQIREIKDMEERHGSVLAGFGAGSSPSNEDYVLMMDASSDVSKDMFVLLDELVSLAFARETHAEVATDASTHSSTMGVGLLLPRANVVTKGTIWRREAKVSQSTLFRQAPDHAAADDPYLKEYHFPQTRTSVGSAVAAYYSVSAPLKHGSLNRTHYIARRNLTSLGSQVAPLEGGVLIKRSLWANVLRYAAGVEMLPDPIAVDLPYSRPQHSNVADKSTAHLFRTFSLSLTQMAVARGQYFIFPCDVRTDGSGHLALGGLAISNHKKRPATPDGTLAYQLESRSSISSVFEGLLVSRHAPHAFLLEFPQVDDERRVRGQELLPNIYPPSVVLDAHSQEQNPHQRWIHMCRYRRMVERALRDVDQPSMMPIMLGGGTPSNCQVDDSALGMPLIGAFWTVLFDRNNVTAGLHEDPNGEIVRPGTRTVLAAYEALWPVVELHVFANQDDCRLLELEFNVECYIEDPTLDREFHIPTINRLFSLGRQNTHASTLLFSNADVVIFPDVVPTTLAAQEKLQEYMVVGVRYDVEDDFAVAWSGIGFELKNIIQHKPLGDPATMSRLVTAQSATAEQQIKSGKMHVTQGIDYYLVSRDFPLISREDFPAFLVGRQRWDNWMLRWAQENGLAVDATQAVTAIHINHETRDDPYGGHADKSCDQTAGSKLCSRAYNPHTPKSHKHNHDLATEAYRHGDILNCNYQVHVKKDRRGHVLADYVASPNTLLTLNEKVYMEEYNAAIYDWYFANPWYWDLNGWIHKCYRDNGEFVIPVKVVETTRELTPATNQLTITTKLQLLKNPQIIDRMMLKTDIPESCEASFTFEALEENDQWTVISGSPKLKPWHIQLFRKPVLVSFLRLTIKANVGNCPEPRPKVSVSNCKYPDREGKQKKVWESWKRSWCETSISRTKYGGRCAD